MEKQVVSQRAGSMMVCRSYFCHKSMLKLGINVQKLLCKAVLWSEKINLPIKNKDFGDLLLSLLLLLLLLPLCLWLSSKMWWTLFCFHIFRNPEFRVFPRPNIHSDVGTSMTLSVTDSFLYQEVSDSLYLNADETTGASKWHADLDRMRHIHMQAR